MLQGLGGALLMIALDLQRKGGGRRVGKGEGEGGCTEQVDPLAE